MAIQRDDGLANSHAGTLYARLHESGWLAEFGPIVTAIAIGIPIMLALQYWERHSYEYQFIRDFHSFCGQKWVPIEEFFDPWVQAFLERYIPSEARRRPPRQIGSPRANPLSFQPSTRRFSQQFLHLSIWGWPSRGGVIILMRADAVDCDFLGLDSSTLSQKRLSQQEDEDQFCQMLLLLGAKWWDSEERFEDVEYWRLERLRGESFCFEPEATERELEAIMVGWPSSGGLWIADVSPNLFWVTMEDLGHSAPDELAFLYLTRTMDERCRVLRDHFSAKFYNRVEDVPKDCQLNAWATKFTGEAGPMLAWHDDHCVEISPGPQS